MTKLSLKKSILSIALAIIICLVVFLTGVTGKPTPSANIIDNQPTGSFEVTQKSNGDITTTEVNNIFSISKDDRSSYEEQGYQSSLANGLSSKTQDETAFDDFLAKNEGIIDESMARTSNNVIMKAQTMRIRDQFSHKFDTGEGGGNSGETPYTSDEYSRDDYVTIYTVAYQRELNESGNRVYYVTGKVKFNKVFHYRNEDVFSFNHSIHGLNEIKRNVTGKFSYTAQTILHGAPAITNNENRALEPQGYTYGIGVFYRVPLPVDTYMPNCFQSSYNWECEGGYYLSVEGDTNVSLEYHHNKKSKGDGITVSFSYYLGLGINIKSEGNEVYKAEAVRLRNV